MSTSRTSSERASDLATGPPEVDHRSEDEGHPRRWSILMVLCVCVGVVILGNSSLNVALPSMARSLDASITQLQWMVDAYALVFAGLLFTSGALGDRYGRKGFLLAGLVVFLVAAMAATVLATANGVVLSRAAMGVGAALVMPSTLSILTNVFPRAERPKAIAMWAVVTGAAGTAGPLASGLLLLRFSWTAVFLVNVPVMFVAFVAVARIVPTSRDPHTRPIDWFGALLSAITITSLVYAIIEAPVHGWTGGWTLGIGAAGLCALAAFVAWELHRTHPMLDMGYFRQRCFSIGSVGMALVYFALFGMMFLMTQYFQLVLGYSALEAGLGLLPSGLVMIAAAPQGPKLVRSIGAHRTVAIGLGIVATGTFAFSLVTVDSPYLLVGGVFVLVGLGMGLAMTPLTASIMAGVPRARSGAGSAMNDTTRTVGGALGVALMGSIATSQYGNGVASVAERLAGESAGAVTSSLAGALALAGQDGTEELIQAAREAFVDGLSWAMVVASVALTAAAVLAWRLLPPVIPGSDAPVTAAPAEAAGR